MASQPDWLLDSQDPRTKEWIRRQNEKTERHFQDHQYYEDVKLVLNSLGRPDKAPDVTSAGGKASADGKIYNFWNIDGTLYNFCKDNRHPQGFWRRISTEDFKRKQGSWDTLLDLDDLSRKEGKTLFWCGAEILVTDTSRAILSFSNEGSTAVCLREWSFASNGFVSGGFNLDEAFSSAAWLDADTLLLASSYGGGQNATSTGKPRTIRLWRRGKLVEESEVIFSTEHGNTEVDIERDWSVSGSDVRLHLIEVIDVDRSKHYIAQGELDFQLLPIPENVKFAVYQHWAVTWIKQDWCLDGTFFPADSLLVMRFEPTEWKPCPKVLWSNSNDGEAFQDFSFINGRICVSLLERLKPVFKLFDLHETKLRQDKLPLLPSNGVVSVEPLDRFGHDQDDTIFISEQNPISPNRVSLATIGKRAKLFEIYHSSPDLDTEGVSVSYHSAHLEGVGDIPYVQTGRTQSDAVDQPLYIYGYGGFGSLNLPKYNKILAVLALKRGWTTVTTCLPGDGGNGLAYENAGRKEHKYRSHDAFAVVANDLVERGVVKSKNIVAAGASNGGLLIGMMFSKCPKHFAGFSLELGLTDLELMETLSMGPAWTAEYPQSLEGRIQISPSRQIPSSASDCPPILIFTNTRDDVVDPAHSRIYACLLQEAGFEAWFYEMKGGGHGYGANYEECAKFFAIRQSLFRCVLEKSKLGRRQDLKG